MKKPRIAIFAYSWTLSNHEQLDGYLDRFVSQMSGFGFDIDVYFANHFTSHAGILGIGNDVDIEKLNKFFKSNDYKMVLSFNNALVSEKIRGSISCPIISLIVDDFNHLFNHDLSGIYDQFSLVDKVMFSSYAHIDRLLANNELVKGKVHFYPTATSADNSNAGINNSNNVRFNISWVASLLDVSGITLLYQRCVYCSDRIQLLNNAVSSVRRGEEIRRSDHFGTETLDDLLREHCWTFGFFEMQIQNLISNEIRVAVANKLHALDLTIFGNLEWINASGYNSKILDSYQAGIRVSSHADIMRIYNSSKICVNIPQVQTGSALPFRVVDIMASKALLITNYHPRSDLFRVFGQDCPVVMYKDLDHLHSLCEYYLCHEDERESLVNQCNKLVSSGFDFSDRCADILRLANVSTLNGFNSVCGDINFIEKNNFVPFLKRLKGFVKSRLKIAVKRVLLTIPLSISRSLILNIRAGK